MPPIDETELSTSYDTPDSFLSLLNKRKEEKEMEALGLAAQMGAAQKMANAPREMSLEEKVATALLGAVPILVGLAAKGKRGASIGGMVGAGAVGQYTKDLEEERERRARSVLAGSDLARQLLKTNRADLAALDKLGLQYEKDKTLLPQKVQYAKELAGYREQIRPNREGIEYGADVPMQSSGTSGGQGEDLIDEAFRPTSLDNLELLKSGKEKYGERFSFETATPGDVFEVWRTRYGDEEATTRKEVLLRLVEQGQQIYKDNLTKEGLDVAGLSGAKVKTYSQALDLARLALANRKLGRISETQATQIATNLSIQQDIQRMKEFVAGMSDDEYKLVEGLFGRKLGYYRSSRGLGPVAQKFSPNMTMGAAKLVDEYLMGKYGQGGGPEYEFLKFGNMLATKYAALYNGKRLSDMDFKIFQELVGTEDFRFMSKDALVAHLTRVQASAQKSFEAQYDMWRKSGWKVPTLDALPSPRREDVDWLMNVFPKRWSGEA